MRDDWTQPSYNQIRTRRQRHIRAADAALGSRIDALVSAVGQLVASQGRPKN
jgi:hypothetical protein